MAEEGRGKDDNKELLSALSSARSQFVKASSVISALSILVAVWARAPSLSISGPIEGFTASFNVGYALFFGPPLIFFGTLWLGGVLRHLYELREAVREAWLSKRPSRVELQLFALHMGSEITPGKRWYDKLFTYGAIISQSFWHFVVPPLAFLFIYWGSFNVVPYDQAMVITLEETKGASVRKVRCPKSKVLKDPFELKDRTRPDVCQEQCLDKATYSPTNFLLWRWLGERVCIPNGHVTQKVQDELPYHYPPINVWLFGFFLMTTIAFSFRSWQLYFAHRYERITVTVNGKRVSSIRFRSALGQQTVETALP